MKNLDKNLITELAYIYVHFCSSTDHMLSIDEVGLIGEKINDAINIDKDNYKETFRITSDILMNYNKQPIDNRTKEYAHIIKKLNNLLTDEQKTTIFTNLKELSAVDGVHTAEIDFIDFLKSQWT